jgi:AP-5 complex subunit zeta-1
MSKKTLVNELVRLISVDQVQFCVPLLAPSRKPVVEGEASNYETVRANISLPRLNSGTPTSRDTIDYKQTISVTPPLNHNDPSLPKDERKSSTHTPPPNSSREKVQTTVAFLLSAAVNSIEDGVEDSERAIQLVYGILNNDWANDRTRILIVEYIVHISSGVLPVIFCANFNGDFAMYYKEDHVVYFLELLVRLETGSILDQNKFNLLNWLDNPSVRMRVLSFACLLVLAKNLPHLLYEVDGLLDSIESKFLALLTNVPLVAAESSRSSTLGGFFGGLGLSRSVGPSLLEPSGNPARDFFTVLNTLPSSGHDYQSSHIAHINLFSMVHSWFMALYHPENDNARGDGNLPLKLGEHMEETIVKYCVRLLDQVTMPKPPTHSSGMGLLDPRLQDDLHESVTVEALRLLDLLCQQNAALVTRLFPIVKRFAIDKFNAHIRRTNSRHAPVIFLTAIQFFVNHNEVTTMFDVEPVFRSFFHDYLRRHYRNSLLAFETIRFCIFNKHKLLTHTSMLFLYFPSLLKLVAWHPHSFRNEFLELLPALISPPSCMEMLHSILDLPLLASIMESSAVQPVMNMSNQKNSVNFDTTGPLKHCAPNDPLHNYHDNSDTNREEVEEGWRGDGDNRGVRKVGTRAQLVEYMLRDESASYGSSGPQKLGRQEAFDSLNGMDGCIWGLPGMEATVETLCHSSNVTVRVHEVCLLVPALLNTYFDVMLVDAPEECVCAMLSIIYERFGILFGPKLFRGRVRRVLLDRLLASFGKFPNFMMPLKRSISTAISSVDTGGKNAELALHSCWIVGEYAHINKGRPAMIGDFFQAIETIVYERLFVLASLGISAKDHNGGSRISGHYFEGHEGHYAKFGNSADLYGTRLMHVLISTLTKLGACSSDLVPRAQLCLTKIVSSKGKFHDSVIDRAKESVRLLKLSSVASNLFGLGGATANGDIIENDAGPPLSSLSFLLQPGTKFVPGNKLHDFSL